MTQALVEQLDAALRDTGRLVAGVGAEQWSEGTPCTDWTVRDLLAHLVNGNRLVARLGRRPRQ